MYHQTILVGRVGTNPEMRYTPTGSAVVNFSVAVNEQYTNSTGEKIKRTIWYRVSVFGKSGEACNQYLKKGSTCLVEGRLTADVTTGSPRVYTKQDGTHAASFEIAASTVRFLSSAGDHAEPAAVVDEENCPF